ncbi:hypothetical protein C8Q79DRAFT_1009783 [Trametes meyenii]|nr:hypothetical protein C8Q79DRAFT_1009783 [Trametes meyenii]
MQTHVPRFTAQLDAKLELLEQLGYDSHFLDHDEHHVPPLSEKTAYIDRDTARWVETEYNWALEEAAESAFGIPDLFDVEEEDEDSCLPNVYDPTFFPRRSAPSTPRTRSQSLTQPLMSFDKRSPIEVAPTTESTVGAPAHSGIEVSVLFTSSIDPCVTAISNR